MPLFRNPLGYAGYAPDPGTATVINSTVRAASATDLANGTSTDTYVSPVTFGTAAAPVVVAAAATPQTANKRFGQVAFTTTGIAAGATQTFVINDSAVTALSTVAMITLYGATTGAALSIQSVTLTTGSITIVVTNGTGATAQAAASTLTFTFWVMN